MRVTFVVIVKDCDACKGSHNGVEAHVEGGVLTTTCPLSGKEIKVKLT